MMWSVTGGCSAGPPNTPLPHLNFSTSSLTRSPDVIERIGGLHGQTLRPPTGSIIVLAFAVPAIAQGGRAEINGTVIDTGNAVVPGATITVTEENTGLQRTTISSSDGKYAVPTLLPGRYTIKAELQGFQTATQTGLVLLVGQSRPCSRHSRSVASPRKSR